jgi:hypothetical protein
LTSKEEKHSFEDKPDEIELQSISPSIIRANIEAINSMIGDKSWNRTKRKKKKKSKSNVKFDDSEQKTSMNNSVDSAQKFTHESPLVE